MIWHQYKRDWLGRLVQIEKWIKIKENGKTIKVLDPDFFGGGMHNMRKPPNHTAYEIQLAEAYPTFGKKLEPTRTIVTDRIRAYELWKEPQSEQVRIILGAPKGDMKFFANSLNVVNYEILEQTEPAGKPKKTIPFDIELSHMFSFSPMRDDSTDFLESIISAISKMNYAWIQILFVRDERIDTACSRHLSALQDAITDITKDKVELQGSLGSNFKPNYRQVKIPSDKKIPEFMRIAYPDYIQREQENLCVMGIRGIFEADEYDANLKIMQSLAKQLRSKQDSGILMQYPSHQYFEQYLKSRILYDDEAINQLYRNEKIWQDGKWGRGRDMVPFFCVTAKELTDTVCHMPYDEALPLRYNRPHHESLTPERSGWILGTDKKINAENVQYGQILKATSKVTVYDPQDLIRHTYVLGSSGCGKTTLLLNLYSHIIASIASDMPCTYIGIDNKDDDTFEFIKCTPPGINVVLLDIKKTDFGINLLELPEHKNGERDVTVSFMVDHILEMFKEFYSQTQTFVQMERLFKLVLQLLYHNIDSPTMADLHNLVMLFKKNGALERIKRQYRIPNKEFIQALESAASLRFDAWTPILNRVEPFVIDKYLRRHFGVRKTTVKFSQILKPGTVVLIRISDTDTPEDAHKILLMSLVSKIWHAVKKRAAETDRTKRTPVVLALDEFQRIGHMGLIGTLLAQARGYGLGLILAHQNASQIERKILEGIMGNCSTMIFGRLSGFDASKIALMVDPAYSEKLRDSLAGLADHAFFIRQKAPDGHESGMPAYTNSLPPPIPKLDDMQVQQIITTSKERYGIKPEDIQDSSNSDEMARSTKKWMESCTQTLPYEMEWRIILYLQDGPHILIEITRGVNASTRDDVSASLASLNDLEYVQKMPNPKVKRSPIYSLSKRALDAYIDLNYYLIGRSEETPLIAQQAVDYYRKKGWFVCFAIQSGDLRPDLVAYDYSTGLSVSVEIESKTEVKSHPEHVKFNMSKWIKLGFDMCHVWSSSKKIEEIREELDDGYDKVRTFVVDLPDDYKPKASPNKQHGQSASKSEDLKGDDS